MTQPTNTDLAKKIEKLDIKVERKHNILTAAFNKFKKEIRNELKPFHDYLVGQEAIDKAKRQGTISISNEVWNILKWLILIIGALVGVKLV